MKREHYKVACPKNERLTVCELTCIGCDCNKGWIDERKRNQNTRYTSCLHVGNATPDRRPNYSSKRDRRYKDGR